MVGEQFSDDLVVDTLDADRLVIGELTLYIGPPDDQFVLVATDQEPETVYEISIFGGREQKIFDYIEKTRGVRLTTNMAAITDFYSNVMYPTELKGRPLYVEDVEETHNRNSRLRPKLGWETTYLKVNPEIAGYLGW